MRKIALLTLLFVVLFHVKESDKQSVELPYAHLQADHSDLDLVVARHHAKMLLPTSFEAPAPSVQLVSRTTGKHLTSRSYIGHATQLLSTHHPPIHLVGGLLCPKAAISVAPRRAFVRLCRWII